MEAIPKTQFRNKTACKIMACFLKISASLVLKFQVLPFIGGWFWVSEFLLDIFEKSLVFYNSYFTLWLLTIQFFCTLWLFDKYKMQDPVQKSVVFPERVKSCNLYRVTGLYSLSILKESKSRRVKSCNPLICQHFFGGENVCSPCTLLHQNQQPLLDPWTKCTRPLRMSCP